MTKIIDDLLDADGPVPEDIPHVLSPSEYFALTDQSQDGTFLGDDWGLTEKPIKTVTKKGFHLHGTIYTAKELIEYTTGDKRGPRPELVARYNRALAARGALETVKVLEKKSTGVYRPICTAYSRDRLMEGTTSWDEFLAYRRAFVEALKSRRGISRRDFLILEDQEQDLKAAWDEQQAYARKRPDDEREVSAKPIYDGEDPGTDGSTDEIGRQLQERRRETNDEPDTRRGGAGRSGSSTPGSDEKRPGLGEALDRSAESLEDDE